jgi:hypothetical protein
MNLCNLKKTFEDYAKKGWDRIFVLLDVHGTIIPSGTHESFEFINPECKEVLQWMSRRPEFRLIFWTSSYDAETLALRAWLFKNDVLIDYVNANPEAKDTSRACFDKKPYYNLVIDDRAGFEPETDWAALKQELIAMGEWDK